MFNGIVYNQGVIKSIRKNPRYVSGSLVIEIASYLSRETLNRSKFKNIKICKSINIEKSLYHGKKISGHYIQGHVDTTSLIKNIEIIDRSWNINLSLNKKNKKFIVEKGSIAINGVSLTVAKVKSSSFQITVIPHTLKLTNLINLKKGDMVNVEFDIVGKYLINIYS